MRISIKEFRTIARRREPLADIEALDNNEKARQRIENIIRNTEAGLISERTMIQCIAQEVHYFLDYPTEELLYAVILIYNYIKGPGAIQAILPEKDIKAAVKDAIFLMTRTPHQAATQIPEQERELIFARALLQANADGGLWLLSYVHSRESLYDYMTAVLDQARAFAGKDIYVAFAAEAIHERQLEKVYQKVGTIVPKVTARKISKAETLSFKSWCDALDYGVRNYKRPRF